MRLGLRTLLLAVLPVLPIMAVSAGVAGGAPRVITVAAGTKIQDAIAEAAPGDTVRIMPGRYTEGVHVDKANITLSGVIVDGQWPRLDGEGKLNDGIIASASGFTAENLHISRYKANGVTTQGADDVILRHLVVQDTGIYGIYPTLGRNILIEDNVASGIEDAAIYVGMCAHVDVRRNELYGNVAAIEIENSEHVLVEENAAYDNTAGILVFALPGLPKKKTENVTVRGNFVYDNNHRNFGEVGSVVANVPPGVGIVVLAADKVRIEKNVIRGNSLGGVVLAELATIPGMVTDPEVDPHPDDNVILANFFHDNGRQTLASVLRWYHYIGRNLLGGGSPEGTVDDLIPRGGDIIVAGKAARNCVSDPSARSFRGEEPLPACDPALTPSAALTMIGAAVEPLTFADPGEAVYAAVCSGCHATEARLIGPPLREIRAKYAGNPDGIAAFALDPKKVRRDYPPMPSQAHLGEAKLKAVAAFFLK